MSAHDLASAFERGRFRSTTLEALALFAAVLFGTLLLFHAQILSGLKVGLGSPHDPRLVTYLLEHSYQCLTRAEKIDCLANPRIFFPEQGITFHSETFWGLLPVYVLIRVLVSEPAISFSLVSMLLAAANCLSMWLLLRRGLSVGWVAAIAASFLFAFGSPRGANLTQSFSFVQFPILLSFFALARLAVKHSDRDRRGTALVSLFWLGIVWQAYSFIYTAFFGCLLLVLVFACSLVLSPFRRRVREVLRNNLPSWQVGALLSALACAPLAIGYSNALGKIGGADWAWIEPRIPQWASYLYQGEHSVMWGWLSFLEPFSSLPSRTWHTLGLGGVTTLLAALGLIGARRRSWFLPVVLPCALLFFLTFRFPGGFTAWNLLYLHIPGVPAFRYVNRAYQILMAVPALGVGMLIQSLVEERGRRAVGAVLLVVVILEQLQSGWGYSLPNRSRLERTIAKSIPSGCRSFFYSPLGDTAPLVSHLDAMWAATLVGLPTINGFSGYHPRGWKLRRHGIESMEDENRIRRDLQSWLQRSRLPATCWIKLDPRTGIAGGVEIVKPNALDGDATPRVRPAASEAFHKPAGTDASRLH